MKQYQSPIIAVTKFHTADIMAASWETYDDGVSNNGDVEGNSDQGGFSDLWSELGGGN